MRAAEVCHLAALEGILGPRTWARQVPAEHTAKAGRRCEVRRCREIRAWDRGSRQVRSVSR